MLQFPTVPVPQHCLSPHLPQFPKGHPYVVSLVKTLYIYLRYLKYSKMFALKKIITPEETLLVYTELTVSLDTPHYLFEPNAGIGRRSSSKEKKGRARFFAF